MTDDVVCNLCKESTPEEDFLLCDGCSRGEHADCCGLAALPARFYFCTRCQSQGHTIKGMIIQVCCRYMQTSQATDDRQP